VDRPPGRDHPIAASSDGDPILAAGALCWRAGAQGLEVLLVLSARWGDWSWPKGKAEPGESLPECAVREVAEETGARIELGVPLTPVTYVLDDGRVKTVHYWAGRVRQQAARSAGVDEIEQSIWLPVARARERLTRPGDFAPLDDLLDRAERGVLDTRPLLVLRHAKARSRAHWGGEEATRPLTRTGRRQAQGLAGLLTGWDPERVLTSPWARCRQTLEPYLTRRSAGAPGPVTAEVLPLLSEAGLEHDPDRVRRLVEELLARPANVLLCTHRPLLPAVVAALTPAAGPEVAELLPDGDPWLSTAEVLVVQVVGHRHSHRVVRRLQSVERYRGETHRNLRH
jgi:8-oxo-(d)GTP phosphatase